MLLCGFLQPQEAGTIQGPGPLCCPVCPCLRDYLQVGPCQSSRNTAKPPPALQGSGLIPIPLSPLPLCHLCMSSLSRASVWGRPLPSPAPCVQSRLPCPTPLRVWTAGWGACVHWHVPWARQGPASWACCGTGQPTVFTHTHCLRPTLQHGPPARSYHLPCLPRASFPGLAPPAGAQLHFLFSAALQLPGPWLRMWDSITSLAFLWVTPRLRFQIPGVWKPSESCQCLGEPQEPSIGLLSRSGHLLPSAVSWALRPPLRPAEPFLAFLSAVSHPSPPWPHASMQLRMARSPGHGPARVLLTGAQLAMPATAASPRAARPLCCQKRMQMRVDGEEEGRAWPGQMPHFPLAWQKGTSVRRACWH